MAIETIEASWSAPRKVRAMCTTRLGGYSSEPYKSLNLAMHVGDDETSVVRNRSFLRHALDLPGEPCWLTQTHSAHVVNLDQVKNRDADAAFTRRPGTVAVVMTADCLPILLCNRTGVEVAAVHAGWRGLLDGVVGAAIEQMASPASQLMAWIGPAIGQSAFEVGDELRNKYLAQFDFSEKHFVANRPKHWLCDLPGLARDILSELGVTEIQNSGYCNHENEALFFSYRRNNTTGRMASLIWIDSCA